MHLKFKEFKVQKFNVQSQTGRWHLEPGTLNFPLKPRLKKHHSGFSESAWLEVNIPALTTGNAENFLTLRSNNHRCFKSATATKDAARGDADHVLAEGNKKLDFLRWREICNRHGVYENANVASRTHETAVALDDKTARVRTLR
jgi:hypothetical protein